MPALVGHSLSVNSMPGSGLGSEATWPQLPSAHQGGQIKTMACLECFLLSSGPKRTNQQPMATPWDQGDLEVFLGDSRSECFRKSLICQISV